MAWTVHYAPHGAELRFTGRLTVQEICDAQIAAMRHVYEGPMRYNVFDYTEIDDVHLDTSDLIRIFDGQKDFLRTHPPYGLALVGDLPALRDLVRLWQVLSRDIPLDATLVRSHDEAQRWLRDNGYLT